MTDDGRVELPCGETLRPTDVDLGMRERPCACGEAHAVVTDAHPPERFLPPELVETLRATVETTSEEMPDFGTPHLLGMVLEEYPDRIAAADCSDDGDVGYALLWVADFDARRLHETIVELVLELMEHGMSHADDERTVREFEEQLLAFDVGAFVSQYRDQRDLERDDVY